MRHARLLLPILLLACGIARAATTVAPVLLQSAVLRDCGDFKAAAAILDQALAAPDLPAADQKQLAFQRDVLDRIKKDYSLTQEALFKKLAASVKNLSRPEFEQWLAAGWFDHQMIDGQDVFVDTSVSNLFFRHPELKPRRLNGKDDVPEQKGRMSLARAIQQAARAQGTPYVLPHHFIATMTVTAAPGAAPAGEMIRAWLPIPRLYPFQDQFALLSASSPAITIAPETSPIRSVFMEQPASADDPTRFQITYGYTTRGEFFDLNPEKIRPADLSDPVLAQYTKEAPHVVFTTQIKTLARETAGTETNPMLQAKAFYNWISAHIRYSFAREYSTLTNLGDYCLEHHYGDCGQEALLFITLCRSQGIPARWQTGWNTFPGAKDIHDWTEIWLAPYGWVPVDPWAGIFAVQYSTALTAAERQELRDFYFGGLDYYRMAANSDHSQPLDPPKKTMRSEDVDFQRGELESSRGNIYFDHCSYTLTIEEPK